MKRKAESAYEVRAFVKERFPGIKFKVRLTRNPFGGDDKYSVDVEVPPGVSVITSGGSKSPTKFAASDPEWTEKLQGVYDALKGEFSNAF
jgi:hypothetical protein